jgi:PAS domain S-box-containing protein
MTEFSSSSATGSPSDTSAPRLDWSVSRLLREFYPDLRLRQLVREHPLLESVSLASLIVDPVSLDAFLDKFASLPQCGSTQVARLRAVLVNELQGFSTNFGFEARQINLSGASDELLVWQDKSEIASYLDNIPVEIPVVPFTASVTESCGLQLETFSHAALEMTQLPLEAEADFLKIFLANMHPDEQPSFDEAVQSAVRSSSTFSWSGQFKTGSDWRYISITLHPPLQGSAPQIWTGILQDLSEINGLLRHFENVLDAAQAYTWRRDVRVSVSQFGQRREKFACQDDGRGSSDNDEWLASVHPDDVPQIQAQIARLERGEVQHETLLYRHKLADGSWIWLRVHAGVSKKDVEGTPLALAGLSFDVTAEMQKLEGTQAALERTAYDLTENIPIGTYTMLLEPDAEVARFGFMSRRFLEITGLSEDEARKDPYRAFACVHPEDYGDWLRKNIHAFTYKLPFREETRLLLNGEERWVLAEAIPRLTEDGIWIWEGVIHDITSQKLSERALQAANKKILEIMREKNQQDKGM